LGFIVPQTVTGFSEDTDADLLAYMAMQADDAETAKLAYAEFYARHVRWLYAQLRHSPVQHLLGGEEAVREFVQDTFQKAFAECASFDSAGIADPVRLCHRARAWLGQIGSRLMLDARREGAPGDFEDPTEAIDEHLAQHETESSSEELEVMRGVLEELPEREQDIVLDWAFHYKPGMTHQRLPNVASAALTKRWSTTPANIRVIRKRTFDKVRAEVTERLADRKFKKGR